MSTHDEDRLSRSLHERADDVSGAPLGLADVQRSARGIQRRRRMAGGLVAAAVVAVAVPLALNLTATPGADRPVAPADTSPSVTPTRAGTPDPSPTLPRAEGVTPLTVQGAPTGAPASVSYLRGSTLVAPGADPVDLPAAYDSVVAYRGGWLAVERRQGTPYVVHLDASGRVTASEKGGDRIVVSEDGVEVSWVEGDKLYLDTTNGHSEQPQSIDLPNHSADASPVGFVAPGSVIARVSAGARPEYWVTDFATHQTLQGPTLAVRATNMRLGLIGVQTSYDNNDGTSCWTVATNRPADREPKSCAWTIESFSASGADVVGYPSGVDGLGSATVALLDARTLEPVHRFERAGDGVTYVSDQVWEDDSHVVASLHEGDGWHLVRLGLDGSVQKLDEAPGAPEESPFHFAAHP